MAESSAKRGPGRPFLPGQSGNKGGRPKELDGLRALIREQGPKLVETLIDIALSEAADDKDRIKASEVLMSYGYGKPTTPVELSNPDGSLAGGRLDLSGVSSAALRELQQAKEKGEGE